MTLTGYDASTPPADPPKTDVVEIYAGGDTPHDWTDIEIAAQTAEYGLPVWVRYPMPGPGPNIDSADFLRWLRAHGVPTGCYTMLDIETGVDPGYVQKFGDRLHSAGYKVAVYGSPSTAYRNPPLDGYVIAHWDNNPALDEGSEAVGDQYESLPAYDLDTFKQGMEFWKIHDKPAPVIETPTATPPTPVAEIPTPKPETPTPPTRPTTTFAPGEHAVFIAKATSRSEYGYGGGSTYIDPGYQCLVYADGSVAHLYVESDVESLSDLFPVKELTGQTVLNIIERNWK